MGVTTDPARVLYVDDDPSFTEMLSTVLERETDCLVIETARDAETGLETVREEPIDCVVSDYSMPGTDGLEFLHSVREEDDELPFLLLTGRGNEEIASEAISAGVTDYIQKQGGTDHYSLLANRITNAVEQYRAGQKLERRNEELERVKNRFQSFLKHSPDVITAIDGEGRIQYHSPAIERVLGYDQEELVGTKVVDHVHPDDRERVSEGFFSLVEEGEGTVTQEYRVEHADGSWVWLESVTSADEEFRDGGYVINSREITERKRRERELEQKTERLEEFASIVSHDLQTPITVADARLEMAMAECDSEHLPPIGDALTRMDEIIDATLTLAREGRVVDETEPVDLDAVADHCFRTVTPEQATVRATTGLSLEADPERLRHVLENLFANAVEHAGEDVTVRVEDLPNGFYVADDGPGIPEDEREKVFEPGYSKTDSGTGFGLAIVEEIVEAHGWTIDATESDAGGARFEISGVETV
ncbi:PAS domain S-box protein [Natronomonas sp. F2-12]|uniref:histidine kinase n=1 Tax=Natronomonas aquatica TaxID=2841590 RepID=A0A9R1CR84_9EURY|nr:PAS domain S-box protein [Natronomonas aquatica]MCQ4333683.1 PAS domain S-box protein [Natronomonas aquatica]